MSALQITPSAGSSRHLVDPELLPALDAMPSFSVNCETLGQIREVVRDVRVPAPPAPEVSSEERFIEGPSGDRLRLLVYTPTARKPTGALLWMHGGGMVMATPDSNEALCRYLAQTAGCVVAAVDYRLAPENPYPAGVEDCYMALRWLSSLATELGLPSDRIALAGESGGGCLAAGVALLARDRGEIAASANFLLYPMLDDRTGTEADPDPSPQTGEFVWTRESNSFAWGTILGDKADGVDVPDYAAPARSEALTGMPLTWIFVGDLDLFAGESLRYARTLVRSGVPTGLLLYPGAYHGFISFAQDAGVSKRAFHDFVDAVKRHFRK